MRRDGRSWPVLVACGLAVTLALALPACKGEKKTPRPDAGAPVAAGAVLTRFDALAPGAASGYPARLVARLGVARAVLHDATVPMPAGLTLHLAWETRDDLPNARRYVTSYLLTVEALAPGAACSVRATTPPAPKPSDGTDSLRVTFGVDYTCSEGRNVSNLAVPVGVLAEEGFTRMGAATGATRPTASPDEPPSLLVVHFATRSAALDDAARKALGEHVKVLKADAELALCAAFRGPSAPGVTGSPAVTGPLQQKRVDAVLAYLASQDIGRTRIPRLAGAGQAPPADDDVELYPFVGDACAPPSPSTKRR